MGVKANHLGSKNVVHPFQNTIFYLPCNRHCNCPRALPKRIRLRTSPQHTRRGSYFIPHFCILFQCPLGLGDVGESPNEAFNDTYVQRNFRIDSAVGGVCGAVLVSLGKVDEEHEAALVGDFVQGVGIGEVDGHGVVVVIVIDAVLRRAVQQDCRHAW